MKFLNHLDLVENEARRMKLYRIGAGSYTPSVSTAGNVIYDTGDNIPKWWDGSNWRDFSHGTSGGVLYDLLVAQNSGSNNNPILRLDPSSGANDDITITGGSNVTVTRTSATGITITATDTNTTYSMMTSSVLGLGKLFSDTTQSVAAGDPSSTSGRTYGIQKNSSNQLVVNVPWTDTTIANTNTTYTLPTTNGANPDLVLTDSGGNQDVVNMNGTANEVEVTGSGTNTITFGLPDDVTIGNNLTAVNNISVGNDLAVTGNTVLTGSLTVSGTQTIVNSNTVNIGDNIIVLNSDETGTPSQNAGIEIERGTGTNQSLLWNESTDKWSTYDGVSTYTPIIQDLYKNFTADSGGTATANTATDTLTLTGAQGLATSRSGDTITITPSTKVTACGIVANDMGSNTTATITHNFGTKDVIVDLWQIGDTTNTKVEADISCTTNTVAITFSTTPSVDIRVVIIGATNLLDNSISYS